MDDFLTFSGLKLKWQLATCSPKYEACEDSRGSNAPSNFGTGLRPSGTKGISSGLASYKCVFLTEPVCCSKQNNEENRSQFGGPLILVGMYVHQPLSRGFPIATHRCVFWQKKCWSLANGHRTHLTSGTHLFLSKTFNYQDTYVLRFA